MEDCARECMNCHDLCLEIINYCLIQGGPYAAPVNIGVLSDCAEICRLTSEFLTRDSNFFREVCNLNEKVCDNCADLTGRFSDDDKMLMCSNVCRETAVLCRDAIDMND